MAAPHSRAAVSRHEQPKLVLDGIHSSVRNTWVAQNSEACVHRYLTHVTRTLYSNKRPCTGTRIRMSERTCVPSMVTMATPPVAASCFHRVTTGSPDSPHGPRGTGQSILSSTQSWIDSESDSRGKHYTLFTHGCARSSARTGVVGSKSTKYTSPP